MGTDFTALASLWVAVVFALFAVLIYAETWRTEKQLRLNRARLAGVRYQSILGRTGATQTWQVRRDLALGEVRERRRLRRLRKVSAAITGVMILSVVQVFTTGPIDPASLVSWGR